MGSTNRTAVITGAGSGVGAAIALALAAQGDNLVLIGRTLKKLLAVAEKARAFGVNVTCCEADLAKDAELERLRHTLEAGHGVDILVHCAAVIERGSIDSAPIADFDSHYRVNVRAPYAITQAILPMLKSRRGEVVFVNSSSGITAKPLYSQYDSTKHALKALADSLRAEVNTDGVRVLSIFLGRTATDIQVKLHAQDGRAYRPELLLQPDDVATAVVNAINLNRTAEVTDIHIRPMAKS